MNSYEIVYTYRPGSYVSDVTAASTCELAFTLTLVNSALTVEWPSMFYMTMATSFTIRHMFTTTIFITRLASTAWCMLLDIRRWTSLCSRLESGFPDSVVLVNLSENIMVDPMYIRVG